MRTTKVTHRELEELVSSLRKSGALHSESIDFRSVSTEAVLKWLIKQTVKLNEAYHELKQYRNDQKHGNKRSVMEEQGALPSVNMICSSTLMREVFRLMTQVAHSNSTVLLVGETGTGKGLVAQTIHDLSARNRQLLVKVNCAALPASLIESELFGHERGSFTGAFEQRIGKFELADKGTLFLDEIGELPQELQAKLLRAIQDKEIERVGGKQTISVDVRIIAATNRDLVKDVELGRFRADLFYRLNVFPIQLPALRDRKVDIIPLAKHFVAHFSRRNCKNVSRISSNVIKKMMAYPWPGNVRELEHQMERCVILADRNVILDIHLPTMDNGPHITTDALFDKTYLQHEKDYILHILKKCRGKVYGPGGAAQILNLKVGTLNSKIKKLGISKNMIIFKRDDF